VASLGHVTPITEFEYRFEELPPGRVPFRRWRFELWHRGLLLRSGWRVTPGDAERALRTAASRRAHALIGLSALSPRTPLALSALASGATLTIDYGAVSCVLQPRGAREEQAAA
jgi:hypothetical protein